MPHRRMIQTFEVFWMVIAKAYWTNFWEAT